MGVIKQINIKNHLLFLQWYYLSWKLDISPKKNDGCKNINGVNPLYLNITHSNGYIEENDVNK